MYIKVNCKVKTNKKTVNKVFKKCFTVLVLFLLVAFAFACGKTKGTASGNENESKKSDEQVVKDMYDFDKNYKDRKVIVAYFSQTGNTKKVAEKISKIFECDMVEIEPVEKYTEFDLTSNDPSTRPMRESKFDPLNPPEEPEDDSDFDENLVTSLPAIKKKNFNRYDTIILGYPIWYGDAPRCVYTFVNENNLENKVIIPFCTSDSDGIEKSVNSLASFSKGNFMSGKRFEVTSGEDEIKDFFTKIGVDIDSWD